MPPRTDGLHYWGPAFTILLICGAFLTGGAWLAYRSQGNMLIEHEGRLSKLEPKAR